MTKIHLVVENVFTHVQLFSPQSFCSTIMWPVPSLIALSFLSVIKRRTHTPPFTDFRLSFIPSDLWTLNKHQRKIFFSICMNLFKCFCACSGMISIERKLPYLGPGCDVTGTAAALVSTVGNTVTYSSLCWCVLSPLLEPLLVQSSCWKCWSLVDCTLLVDVSC